jgi:hypothetical protein
VAILTISSNKRSNNGIQHICALTRDEVTAPHANLVPLELPGDLYAYIAEHVWEKLEVIVGSMPESQKSESDKVIDELISIKQKSMATDPKSEERRLFQELIYDFKTENMKALKAAAPVFWHRVTDKKHRRKIAKRNAMTLS